MNVIRIKIVVFWVLFLGLVLVLYCSWSHRIVWLLLFLAAGAITGSIGPRISYPRDRAKVMMTLFGVAGVIFLFAFIVHGFLFPQSAGLTLAMKVLMPLALLPALCCKAHGDYFAFRSSRGRGAPKTVSPTPGFDNRTPASVSRDFRQNTMRSKRLWRHVVVSLIAAGPAGGFMLGLLNAGDPDPNPVGRVFHACMMAVVAPLHAGFPPHNEAGAGQSFNAWPHIAISYLLIFSWFVYHDRKLSKKRNEAKA